MFIGPWKRVGGTLNFTGIFVRRDSHFFTVVQYYKMQVTTRIVPHIFFSLSHITTYCLISLTDWREKVRKETAVKSKESTCNKIQHKIKEHFRTIFRLLNATLSLLNGCRYPDTSWRKSHFRTLYLPHKNGDLYFRGNKSWRKKKKIEPQKPITRNIFPVSKIYCRKAFM